MANETDVDGNYFLEFNTRLNYLEEKQRIIKDRVLILGNNLIETREDFRDEIIELKKQTEELKKDLQRIKSLIESFSDEFSKLARKEDLNILVKQAKMFQPLDLVTRSDLEKLKNK